MLHKEFWGLVFLGFVFWILAAATPTDRIAHACRPVGWTGNVVVSLSALVLPNQQAPVEAWFKKIEYGCTYTVWRLFYQDEYNKWKAATEAGALTPAAAQSTGAASSASAPSKAGSSQ